MSDSILNAALEYASRGWSVIPINRNKQPLIKWKTATREELTDPNNIRKWWKQFPSANVAIVTGKRSGGLVVIDLDIDDEKGVNGKESLEDWCEENNIFGIESCATVATGRGGQHLYFQSDNEYHNQVGCLEGVDIRGEGGCIVAPPSIHGGTRREYLWDTGTEIHEVEVPKADSDVVYFLASMELKGTEAPAEEKKNDFTKVTEKGGRNNQLFKYASRLQGDGETDEAIRQYVKVYNETHLIPPLDDDEVERTLESVLSHKEWKGTSQKKAAVQEEPKLPEKKKEVEFRKLKTAVDLMNKDIPEPIVYVGVGEELPFLVEGTCILSAKPKLGKSWLVLSMCLAIAKGEDFLGYKTRKCSTLYLDLETGESLEQKRLRRALDDCNLPPNFYIDQETLGIEHGFVEQIEHYLDEDPQIGVVAIDVFQLIRTPAKNSKENEYEHAYRDISPLNELAQRRHISIILVSHDRKAVDPDDPFSNILGSTGLQGAATQMIVMFRRKKEDPIHISVKGKTIDGLPEMNVKLEDAKWSVVEGVSQAEMERSRLDAEFENSDIRRAIVEIMKTTPSWRGRCSAIVNEAIHCNVAVEETPKQIGGFLHRHQGRFLKRDGIQIDITNNGSGSKIYTLRKTTVDTVDAEESQPLMGFEKVSVYAGLEVPFL